MVRLATAKGVAMFDDIAGKYEHPHQPLRAHRAPDPAPVDEPVPEPPAHPHQPHPLPQDDPVPDHNPS
jgi:hypothetical protein